MAAAKQHFAADRLNPRHFFSAGRIIFSVTLLCALALPALAASTSAHGAAIALQGATANTASAQPKPAREKKVFTNDDVESLRKNYGSSTVGEASPDDSSAPADQPAATEIIVPRSAAAAQLPPEQNPVFYAEQYASLSANIAAIDAQIQRLRSFTASDAAPGSSAPGVALGLNIYAPTPAMTIDAHIQQLLQQRAELTAQASDLEDRARINGIAPGVFRLAPEIAQSAANSSPLTPKERAALTREKLVQLQTDIAIVDGTQAAMHQQAAAQNVKIIPETKFGGGFTADFMKQLNLHKAVIQQQVSTVEDNARHEGIAPSTLP